MVASRPLTIAEFETEARDGRWELIDGEPVEVAPSSDRSSWIATEIAFHIRDYLRDRPTGRVFGADAGFVLFPDRQIVRVPDAAFVKFERLPELTEGFIAVPPDLAVEVLSPTDRLPNALSTAYCKRPDLPGNKPVSRAQSRDLVASAGERGLSTPLETRGDSWRPNFFAHRCNASMYLQAGAPLVWLIDPRKHTATIFRQDEGPVTVGEDGVLDGEEVLPGFTLPLAKLLA